MSTIRTLACTLVLSSLALVLPPPWSRGVVCAKPDDRVASLIVGRWKCVEEETLIEIVKLGPLYVGTIVLNPANTVLNGKRILRGLHYDSADSLWHGDAFVAASGKYVPATLRARTKDLLVLTVGSGARKQELTWRRAS